MVDAIRAQIPSWPETWSDELPEPSWTNPQRWAELVGGTNCPLCDRGARAGVVAELRACFLIADETVSVRGYCCLILKRHAVEIHQLSAADAADFMADIQAASRAVQQVTGAIKVNYEVHGNVIPHVHMHLVPRYPGDAIELTGLTWHSLEGPVYGAGEFDHYIRGLAAALRRFSSPR